jgi:hypothetical protein
MDWFEGVITTLEEKLFSELASSVAAGDLHLYFAYGAFVTNVQQ